MHMKVQFSPERRTIVCSLVGDLDRHNFADFAAGVAGLIRPNVHVAFDLADLQFIDSSGLRALRASARRVRRGGGRVSAINVPAQVAKTLALAGLDEVTSVNGQFQDVVWWPPPAS
jgi:stage II sporulation protein AA (anti-sigma F factor antagonist)